MFFWDHGHVRYPALLNFLLMGQENQVVTSSNSLTPARETGFPLFSKVVVFSRLPTSTREVCVLERVSSSSIPFPLILFPIQSLQSPCCLGGSEILLLLLLLAGCEALISISIAGFLLRLPHRPGGQTRSPLFPDGMFSQP